MCGQQGRTVAVATGDTEAPVHRGSQHGAEDKEDPELGVCPSGP